MTIEGGGSRLKTIDGLRGVAALSVVFYHLNVAAHLSYGMWTPRWIDWLIHQGFLGVEVFFVLSGFVIAYSVRNGLYTMGFLGRFALRRFIRLDPPYWAAIALEMGLIWLSIKVSDTDRVIPSFKQTAAHIVYLQHVLQLGDIVPVFWTLCYEVQFYIFLIALLVVGRTLRHHLNTDRLAFCAFAVLFVVSVLIRYCTPDVQIPGLALLRWFQFFLGVMVWWVIAGKVKARYLLAAWGLVLAVIAWAGQSPVQALPVAISGLLWWSYQRDGMATILSARPWQFLGTISYSLYLFHSSIGWRLVRAPHVFLGLVPSRLAVLAIYLASAALVVAFSWAAWRLWERPFQRLSRSAFRHHAAESMVLKNQAPLQDNQEGVT